MLRCRARVRDGGPCRNWAVRGWAVCRMHGARGGRRPLTGQHTRIARGLRAMPEGARQEFATAMVQLVDASLSEHVEDRRARAGVLKDVSVAVRLELGENEQIG